MTLKEHILDYLMDPNVAFILLAIGALALYAEFNHPGAVVPGTVGVVFILVAAFALNLLPTRFAALVLILGAFALFAAEAKFASHGVLTVGGIVLLTLGGCCWSIRRFPEMRVHLVTALAVSIPLGVITAFLMSIALKARRNKLVSGAEGLIGETGIAQTALAPRGKSFRAWRNLGCGLFFRRFAAGRARGGAADGWVAASGRSPGGHETRAQRPAIALTVPRTSASNCSTSEFRALGSLIGYNPPQQRLCTFERWRHSYGTARFWFHHYCHHHRRLYVLSSIKILAEYERGVIFRLGRLLSSCQRAGRGFGV